MPNKSSCCCTALGQHIAVACRYYGTSAVFSLPGDGTEISNLSGIGYAGPDGFTPVTGGIQKLFGKTSYIDTQGGGFGSQGGQGVTGFVVRGPWYWDNDAKIINFDDTRDVVILSRSGGGSSQFSYTEGGKPKGGNSALLQSRIKSSLLTEVLVGTGGNNYLGGFATVLGNGVSQHSYDIIGGGAGGGGGIKGNGGHGGVCFGLPGLGSNPGQGGTPIHGGCAGGSDAQDGKFLFGGTGAILSGGGGGGKYGGGGGSNQSGGGGGSSKYDSSIQPNSSGISADYIFSENGSDSGPGGICDPFITGLYYPNISIVQFHAGLGGGVSNIPNGWIKETYNPFKFGLPGIVTAVWIDKYCPCELSGVSAGGNTSGSTADVANFTNTTTDNSSTKLPSKLYICLTDDQYQVIKDYADQNSLAPYDIRFTIENETYIYLGRCSGAYCSSVRSVTEMPTNLSFAAYYNENSPAITKHGCCEAILCRPLCRASQTVANCFNCRCVTGAENILCNINQPVAKYCCNDVGTDSYYSISDGWLWECSKAYEFWYDFGKKPEENPFNDSRGIISNYEKGCLPVTLDATTSTQDEISQFIENNCFSNSTQNIEDCKNYAFGASCYIKINRQWGGSLFWDANISGNFCFTDTGKQLYNNIPNTCDCTEGNYLNCIQDGCVSTPANYNASVSKCELFFNGGVAFKSDGCKIEGQTNKAILFSYAFTAYPYEADQDYLGLIVSSPRCHPNKDDPQITDPVLYDGPSISQTNFPHYAEGGIATCEKDVSGYGSLSDFISVLSENTKLPLTYEIVRNFWISGRPTINTCNSEKSPPIAAADRFTRVEIVETLDTRIYRYYFKPAFYRFTAYSNMSISSSSYGYGTKYQNGIVCNDACICVNGKTYEFQVLSTKNTNTYFSAPYYLYQNSAGQVPTMVAGTFVPNEFDPYSGGAIDPFDLNPFFTLPDGSASIPHSDCINRTPDNNGLPPSNQHPCDREIQKTLDNYCVGNLLTINIG